MSGPAPGGGFGPTFSQCPQCNMFHPPVAANEICPLAPVKVETTTGKTETVDVNKFIADLKNILVANIEKNKIKDVKKLFALTVVEVAKFLEKYKE